MIEKKDIALEKTVLIGVITRDQDEEKSKEYLDELEFLTYTAGGEVLKRFTQKLDKPHPKTFIGKGKMEDVERYIKGNDIGTAIFDDELSPAQERNISEILDCKVLTDIILKKNHTIRWTVKEDDAWSFNTELFPDGHNADGIPVPALDSYALPGESIGMLLGITDEDRILSMGLSGSFDIGPNGGGNYLYLTMNDDLIGKYGEGYRDNEGEILVSITQIPRKVAEIYIMFIEGCPGVLAVAKYIEEVIAEEAVDAEISMVLMETLEDARQLHFTGSPTVRINGKDVETDFLDIKDYGVRSRQYYAKRQEI